MLNRFLQCFLPIIFILCLVPEQAISKNIEIYVSPSGSDRNKGTLEYPLRTIPGAMQLIRKLKADHALTNIYVLIRGGIYQLEKPLIFNEADGGSEKLNILYQAYKNENVIISGGISFKLDWRLDTRNIWKAQVKGDELKKKSIRTMYMDGVRMKRSSSKLLFTEGPIPKYRSEIIPHRYDIVRSLGSKSINAFCGFQYSLKDENITDVGPDAEIKLFGSWEASWHRIHGFNRGDRSVLLKSPSRYPIGFFNNKTRYLIENDRRFLKKDGDWYFKQNDGVLYMYSVNGKRLAQSSFTFPNLENLVTITGVNKPVRNLFFKNIVFRNTNSKWGIHKSSVSITSESLTQFPWIDLTSGFTSAQGAFDSGEAILLVNAMHCKFQFCKFEALDNYAIRIGENSHFNEVVSCEIKNSGGGGIIIGFDEREPVKMKMKVSQSPSSNRVADNKIHDNGLLHPASIGIAVLQANNNFVTRNLVYNMPYSGISSGWTFSSRANFTSNNIFEKNIIHDVMLELADGGGIYTVGSQNGTTFRYNVIYNVKRNPNVVGSKNNGFFFDQYSSGLKVDSNVVYAIADEELRFNKAIRKNIDVVDNYLDKSHRDIQLKSKILNNTPSL